MSCGSHIRHCRLCVYAGHPLCTQHPQYVGTTEALKKLANSCCRTLHKACLHTHSKELLANGTGHTNNSQGGAIVCLCCPNKESPLSAATRPAAQAPTAVYVRHSRGTGTALQPAAGLHDHRKAVEKGGNRCYPSKRDAEHQVTVLVMTTVCAAGCLSRDIRRSKVKARVKLQAIRSVQLQQRCPSLLADLSTNANTPASS